MVTFGFLAAEVNEKGIDFHADNMKPEVVYDSPKGCWHKIAMSEDTEILITEDANTHSGDYEFHYFSEDEGLKLRELIISFWNE